MYINVEHYMDLLYAIEPWEIENYMLMYFSDGLVIKFINNFGTNESGIDEGEEGYYGDYYTIIDVIEIVKKAEVEEVLVDQWYSEEKNEYGNKCIEISLLCVPEKVEKEDGTLVWEK